MLRQRVQHQLAQATRGRAFQQAEPSEAGEIRQRKDDFNRGGRAGRTCLESPSAEVSARVPPAFKTEINLRGCIAGVAEPYQRAAAYYFRPDRNGDRPAF